MDVERSQRGGDIVTETTNPFFQASPEQRNDSAPAN
jgi:hypothetical protein